MKLYIVMLINFDYETDPFLVQAETPKRAAELLGEQNEFKVLSEIQNPEGLLKEDNHVDVLEVKPTDKEGVLQWPGDDNTGDLDRVARFEIGHL